MTREERGRDDEGEGENRDDEDEMMVSKECEFCGCVEMDALLRSARRPNVGNVQDYLRDGSVRRLRT